MYACVHMYLHECYGNILLYVGYRFNVISMVGEMRHGEVCSTIGVVFVCYYYISIINVSRFNCYHNLGMRQYNRFYVVRL